jgi:hypothetical protein
MRARVKKVRAEWVEEFAEREAYRRIHARGEGVFRGSISRQLQQVRRSGDWALKAMEILEVAEKARMEELQAAESMYFEENR